MSLERLIPGTQAWNRHGHQHLQRYAFALPRVRGKRTLDLACGVGYGAYVLASVCPQVEAIDLDPEAIRYARAHYLRTNVSYAEGDALRYQAAQPFEAVTSFETIEHLPDPPAFVRTLSRNLQPNGLLLISAPNILQYQRGNPPVPNPFHLSEPDYATLCAWLEPEFEVLEEWEQSPTVPSDDGFDVPAAVQDLRRQGIFRIGQRAETLLRRLWGRPLAAPIALDRETASMCALTSLMPLLPERRDAANVFLFVCRRR
jgi:SAM-dependent methyltransferase